MMLEELEAAWADEEISYEELAEHRRRCRAWFAANYETDYLKARDSFRAYVWKHCDSTDDEDEIDRMVKLLETRKMPIPATDRKFFTLVESCDRGDAAAEAELRALILETPRFDIFKSERRCVVAFLKAYPQSLIAGRNLFYDSFAREPLIPEVPPLDYRLACCDGKTVALWMRAALLGQYLETLKGALERTDAYVV
jgi:hypothetical protein